MVERNIRGEIQAAVVVVVLLALLALAAFLLSLVSSEPPAPPPTQVVDSNVATSSPTDVPTTVVPTTRPTIEPTSTPRPSGTPTERPPTSTPVPTKTEVTVETPAPTKTDVTEETPATESTVDRAVRRLTEVAAEPSATGTATSQPETTATRTAMPTQTAEHPTVAPCQQPVGWAVYTVERGNTLFSIARAVGSTVGELRTVNCLSDASNIVTGDALFVPRLPTGPVQTGVPNLPSEQVIQVLALEGCTSPAISISSPAPGQRISGTFEVRGTAAIDEFGYLRLEVRPDFTNIYNFYSRSENPVSGGLLGRVNAELFDDGLYWIRLTVVDQTGNFPEPCAIPVIFD